MNQRTANNLSLLDIGKAGIEQMVRRFPNGLKFLLVTTRSGGTVESGWHDSQDDFLAKVKNLVARDLSDLPVACISSLPDCQFHQPSPANADAHFWQGALRCAFDTLEQRRSSADLESYGFGRQPWMTLDAAAVWVITDGCSLNRQGQPFCQSTIVYITQACGGGGAAPPPPRGTHSSESLGHHFPSVSGPDF